MEPGIAVDYPLHRITLPAGLFHIEGLVGLADLPSRFVLVVAPLPLVNGSGSPARVLAIVQHDAGEARPPAKVPAIDSGRIGPQLWLYSHSWCLIQHRRSRVSTARQIGESIEALIERGELRPGDVLPSVRGLGTELATVR